MAEIIKETVITKGDNTGTVATTPAVAEASTSQTIEYLIYFCFGLLEILLAFRLVLKLMGASLASGFVRILYSITGIFILPFEGIFRRAVTNGIETASVLEPSTLVAIIVYVVVAWGIVQLLRIFSKRQVE